MRTMRVCAMSDLHFEFHRDGGEEFIRSLEPDGTDALILAGDVSTGAGLERALAQLCERFPDVIYVAGNHELYGSSFGEHRALVASIAGRLANLHALDNSTVTLHGRTFAGTTLWFPPSLHDERYRDGMNDFVQIRGFTDAVHGENARASNFLADLPKGIDCVITHHLPSERLIAEEYKFQALNCFFFSPEDATIAKKCPGLWVYGHTHTSGDTRHGHTRMLCNPLGYPHCPNRSFDGNLTVEL